MARRVLELSIEDACRLIAAALTEEEGREYTMADIHIRPCMTTRGFGMGEHEAPDVSIEAVLEEK